MHISSIKKFHFSSSVGGWAAECEAEYETDRVANYEAEWEAAGWEAEW